MGFGGVGLDHIPSSLHAGVTFPAMHALIASWASPQELSRAVALASSGQFLGTVAAFSFAPQAYVASSK